MYTCDNKNGHTHKLKCACMSVCVKQTNKLVSFTALYMRSRRATVRFCAHMHTHTHTYTYTYVHIHIHIHIHTRVHTACAATPNEKRRGKWCVSEKEIEREDKCPCIV